MSSDWYSDNRVPRLRRLITAAITYNITTLLIGSNTKRDDFTTGSMLILAETIETSWLKQSPNLKTYADQGKLFKSSMYKIKAGQFLREQGVGSAKGGKMNKIEGDIDEIKKHLKMLSGVKRTVDGNVKST
jgi:hypothetical protein